MRFLRYLLAIALACTLAPMARAANFAMVVVDPYTGPYTTYPITSLTGNTFTFSECEEPGQLPAGAQYDECFTGQNETGATLTSLEITLPLISGFDATCQLSTLGLDLFPNVTCTTTSTGYVLDFSGGSGIPSGSTSNSTFTIAEAGVTSGFPNATGNFNTPEPSSIWLMSTGILSVGLFGLYRRRTLLGVPQPASTIIPS